ncbi:LuxR family transcriptional regulator [Marinobacterium marinum]|uniref:PAS domain S-box protein n=1 Tax=Marinobacterium marinum TaxID=2756129 RepID=A0A7W2AB40_9GAMM|nr:LuxR C-terminal-related transcriptional regulator [Marinobacterium marinum]MBA4501675.1 PAS domain S-box protein [Marinobacterium marinum]
MSSLPLSDNILSVAFEHAPCAIVVTRHRQVEACNQAFCKLFGYPENELVGQLMLKMYPSYEDYELIGKLRYQELLKEHHCIDERFMRCKNGEMFWCKTQGKTLTPAAPFDLAIWTFTRINIRPDQEGNLSIREREISGYIANGYTCKEIAKRLDISHRTVEAHRAKIMKKLGCRNTAELVSKIIQVQA